MLKFTHYDMLGTPLIIKEECSDAENVDDSATKRTESEEIAIIKCEEVHIKDELDNGESCQLGDYNNLGTKGSSDRKRNVGKCELKDKMHFCPKCPYSTKRIYNLNTHMRTHPDNERYCCTLCSFVTDSRLLLQDHMTAHKGATKRYGCWECSYETDLKTNLEKHILRHKDISEVEMHKCLVCRFKSKYKSKLTSHHKLHHDKTIKLYKCQECSFSTKYRHCLVRHHLVHEDPNVVNKFKCEKCPFRTKRQISLQKHMIWHIPEHTNRFRTWDKSHLKGHRLAHMELGEIMWYFCGTCDFKTVYKANLKVHTKNCARRMRIIGTDDKKKK